MTCKYELKYIKIPEGLGRKLRNDGNYRPVIFWFKLKPIYKSGKFDKKTFLKLVQSYYKISETSIRSHLKKLKGLKLIIESKDSYQLVSYDKLFEIYGYNLDYKKKNGQVLRKGKFAIDKIEVETLDFNNNELELRIDCGELKLNDRRQYHYIKKVVPDENKMSNVYKKSTIMDKHDNPVRFVYDGMNIEKFSKSTLSQITKNFIVDKINTLSGISCRGIAKILGYKSTKSVFDLKKKAMKAGFIKVVPQRIVLKKFTDFCTEVFIKYHVKDFHFKYQLNGELYYQLQDDFIFLF